MESLLFATTVFFAALTFIFGYIALSERRKRERVLSSLRSSRSKEEASNQKTDGTKLLARALSLIHEGIVIMDPFGRIIFTNHFARDLLDIDPKDKGKFFYQ
ncbi:MAG: PAS domain-containing protein, partial [Desulfurobacteriaceae bacterium]